MQTGPPSANGGPLHLFGNIRNKLAVLSIETDDAMKQEQPMSNLNIVICPGCASELPYNNSGCPECGYENNNNSRLLTIAEIMEHANCQDSVEIRLNDVCPAFIEAIVTAAQSSAKKQMMNTRKTPESVADDVGRLRMKESEFEQGVLYAASVVVAVHDMPVVAATILREAGLADADCSGLDDFEKKYLRMLHGEAGIALRGLVDRCVGH